LELPELLVTYTCPSQYSMSLPPEDCSVLPY
jgi:hypothetical protein